MQFLNWLSNLGEKSSRTDVWVVLITMTYISCLFNIVPCTENFMVISILGGMFADLGIKTFIDNKYKNNDVNK